MTSEKSPLEKQFMLNINWYNKMLYHPSTDDDRAIEILDRTANQILIQKDEELTS